MSTKKNKNQDQELINVENALSASEVFIEKYKNQILYVVGSVVLVVLAILAFKAWYIAPREVEAEGKIAICQEYFAKDSFQLALKGDGTDEFLGFEKIAKEYGMTKTANLALAYAAVCNYRLLQYEEAIAYLKKVDFDSPNLTPATVGLMGDCYVQLGDYKSALKYYEKAVKEKNDLTAPLYLKKAAFIYEKEGDFSKAIECYTIIKDKYFKSMQASDIEKYIERAKALQQ